MENGYRLKYYGKWLKIKRILGQYTFELFDNEEDVKPERWQKTIAGKGLIIDDCGLNSDEIEIIDCGEILESHKPIKTIDDFLKDD